MPDRISRQERVKRLHRFREVVKKLFTPLGKACRQIHHQTADTEIARRHTSAGRCLDKIQYLFTLTEAKKERRHRAEIKPVRPKPHHVRGDALKFAEKHTDHLSSFRYLKVEKLLGGHHIREIVSERIQIIHPIRDDDALLIFLVFKELLHSGVQITDIRNGLQNKLAVKAKIEPKHAVRGRMLRPHRKGHFGLESVVHNALCRRRIFCDGFHHQFKL